MKQKQSNPRYRHSRRCDGACSNTCGGSWEAWVWIPQEQKKKRQTFPDRAAAKGWLTDARKAAKDGKLRAGDSRISVSDWLETWLQEWAPRDASPDVVSLYRLNVKTHVAPAVGHIRLVNLRRSDCNELVNVLFKKGLARNTIKGILTPLRLALTVAVDEEKIPANPAVQLTIPKKAPTRKLHVPTLDEVKKIFEKTEGDGLDAIMLDATLGLRRCELLALRWCDIDLERGLVHVRQKNIRGEIRPGAKTEAGVRMVPLYATARTLLEARADRQGLTRQWLPKDERLIFANKNGGPVDPRNWSRRVWEPARKAAGLSDVRLHDLRHFNVTALRELAMDNKLRSVVTGHTDTRTTEKIYDHVRPEHVEAAAKRYDPLAG